MQVLGLLSQVDLGDDAIQAMDQPVNDGRRGVNASNDGTQADQEVKQRPMFLANHDLPQAHD